MSQHWACSCRIGKNHSSSAAQPSAAAFLWGLGCFSVVQQLLGEGKCHPQGCRAILRQGFTCALPGFSSGVMKIHNQKKKKKKSFLQPDCAESSTQGVGQVQEELRELWKSLWSSSELRSPCWRRDRTEDLGNPCGVWEGRSRKWKRICDLSQP